MIRKRHTIPVVCILMLVISSLACNLPGQTPEPATPHSPPDTAEPQEEAPPPVEATEEIPEISPPAEAWLPEGTIALVRSGPWGAGQLKAVNAAGLLTDMGISLHAAASISNSGRWVASADSPSPASAIVVRNLEDSTSYSIPLTAGWTLYASAFDNVDGRLAFMELGASGGTYQWAVVVVDLTDGSTERFETSFAIGVQPPILPGRPMGWDASGDQLLLDTFMPDTEGNWAGIWGVTVPPGAISAPLDSLSSVQYLAMGEYLTTPVLSRDAAVLVYLDRDYAYTPDYYEVMAYDLVVNQLWTLDLASNTKTNLVDAVDGSALFRDAAWSMNSSSILYGQGTFAGGAEFDTLGWKTHSGGGETPVGPAAIPAGGSMQTVEWCRPGIALATARNSGNDTELHMVDLAAAGSASVVDTQQWIEILGCVP